MRVLTRWTSCCVHVRSPVNACTEEASLPLVLQTHPHFSSCALFSFAHAGVHTQCCHQPPEEGCWADGDAICPSNQTGIGARNSGLTCSSAAVVCSDIQAVYLSLSCHDKHSDSTSWTMLVWRFYLCSYGVGVNLQFIKHLCVFASVFFSSTSHVSSSSCLVQEHAHLL